MVYDTSFSLRCKKTLESINRETAQRIIEKIKWLAEHADEIVHHQLIPLPDELKGLCRVGDWRVFYVVHHKEKRIVIRGIAHRSEAHK